MRLGKESMQNESGESQSSVDSETYEQEAGTGDRKRSRPTSSSLDFKPEEGEKHLTTPLKRKSDSEENIMQSQQENGGGGRSSRRAGIATRARASSGIPPHRLDLSDLEGMSEDELLKALYDDPELAQAAAEAAKSKQEAKKSSSVPSGSKYYRDPKLNAKDSSSYPEHLKAKMDDGVPVVQWIVVILLLGVALFQLRKTLIGPIKAAKGSGAKSGTERGSGRKVNKGRGKKTGQKKTQPKTTRSSENAKSRGKKGKRTKGKVAEARAVEVKIAVETDTMKAEEASVALGAETKSIKIESLDAKTRASEAQEVIAQEIEEPKETEKPDLSQQHESVEKTQQQLPPAPLYNDEEWQTVTKKGKKGVSQCEKIPEDFPHDSKPAKTFEETPTSKHVLEEPKDTQVQDNVSSISDTSSAPVESTSSAKVEVKNLNMNGDVNQNNSEKENGKKNGRCNESNEKDVVGDKVKKKKKKSKRKKNVSVESIAPKSETTQVSTPFDDEALAKQLQREEENLAAADRRAEAQLHKEEEWEEVTSRKRRNKALDDEALAKKLQEEEEIMAKAEEQAESVRQAESVQQAEFVQQAESEQQAESVQQVEAEAQVEEEDGWEQVTTRKRRAKA